MCAVRMSWFSSTAIMARRLSGARASCQCSPSLRNVSDDMAGVPGCSHPRCERVVSWATGQTRNYVNRKGFIAIHEDDDLIRQMLERWPGEAGDSVRSVAG